VNYETFKLIDLIIPKCNGGCLSCPLISPSLSIHTVTVVSGSAERESVILSISSVELCVENILVVSISSLPTHSAKPTEATVRHTLLQEQKI
jgi:hypothetical protein